MTAQKLSLFFTAGTLVLLLVTVGLQLRIWHFQNQINAYQHRMNSILDERVRNLERQRVATRQ